MKLFLPFLLLGFGTVIHGNPGILGGLLGGDLLGKNGLLGGILGGNGLLGVIQDLLVGENSLAGLLSNDGLLGNLLGEEGLLSSVIGKKGLLNQLLCDDSVLGKILGSEGLINSLLGNEGLVGQLVCLIFGDDGLLRKILSEDGPISALCEILLGKNGALGKLTGRGGLLDKLLGKDGCLQYLLTALAGEDGLLNQVINNIMHIVEQLCKILSLKPTKTPNNNEAQEMCMQLLNLPCSVAKSCSVKDVICPHVKHVFGSQEYCENIIRGSDLICQQLKGYSVNDNKVSTEDSTKAIKISLCNKLFQS